MKFKHKCKRCGYVWEGFKEFPKQCVYCKSYKWDVDKPDYVENTPSQEVKQDKQNKKIEIGEFLRKHS